MFYAKNIVIFSLLVGGFVYTSNAQTPNASIVVKVTNQLDETIVDAEVTLIESEQIKKQTKTDVQGIGRFSNLIDGKYQITITAQGFKGYQSEPIIVKTGEHKTVSAILEIAPIESKVNVGGDDEADTDNFGTTRVLKQETIDKLPDNPDDMERVLRQLAGQSVTGEDLPITIDGFSGGKLPPKQAIQQIRINQNIFSAQYEGPYGGGIEIFTKSDIDKFHGGVSFNFVDSRLNASNPYIGQRLPSQNRGYDLGLSGPLVRKKASFQLSVSHNDNDSSAAINAVTLNSIFQPVEYKRFFPNPSRLGNIQFFIKADPTKKHKIAFNYFFENRRSEGQGIGDFSLPSRAYNNKVQSHTLQISDTYLANENVVSQTRFQILYTKDKSFGGSSDAAINVLDAFSGGGSQIDGTNKDLRLELFNDTTWQMGKYGLGFGWKVRGQRINRISRSNFGGTYTFAGRLAPVLDANNNPVIDASGNILTTQISSLENYRRTLLFRQAGYSNERIRELGGGASQFSISGGNPELSANQFDVGLYVQNSYKVNKQVALSFGVRYENQTNINSNDNFSPRFGIIWSPKADKKKSPLFALPKISAGIGMFYSRFGINNILNVEQASDDRLQYFITDADILGFYPNVPSIDLLERFALPKTKRIIDAEIQTPLQKLFNINITKKLPSDFSVSLSYSRTRSSHQLITRNINAPLAGTLDLSNPDTAIYPFGNARFAYLTTSNGKSETDGINIRIGLPENKFFKTYLSYSFYKIKDNIVGGSGSPFDPYDFSREFGPGERDARHLIFFSMSSDLPFGFGITNFLALNSGTRFNIITGRDTNGDGFYTERPAFASDLTKPNLVKTKYGILDPNPSPTDTIIPRNLGRGPATFNLDTIIDKSFGFGADKDNKKKARYSLNTSIYIRNILNINNQGNPIGNMSSPYFLRQISYNSDASNVFASSAGVFSGFSGRSLNFHVGFSF